MPRILRQLGPEARVDALRFCARQPERTAYIAGWIAEGGLERRPQVSKAWLLAETVGAELVGLVYVSATGIVMPSLSSDEALEGVVDVARANPAAVRVLVGERRQIAALWRKLGRLGLEARLSRDQLGYAATRATFRMPKASLLPLEIAHLAHLDQVVDASAKMAREEAGDDPQARNPEMFRTRIEERLARGRDFIHVERGKLVFKSNVAVLSELGGQIEGIYTPPFARGRHLGKRGTAAVTAWVLERAERAVLLVNEDNIPAIQLYEDLGYQRTHESRTIFVAP
ncbi:GNAT family N-acetyltransferase [Myxococcota bacterium]|nr:GNAT family N-acetyltransferase [Myxococcota bacterium]